MTHPSQRAGLQAQRTALAWGRTALALLVTTLLIMRAGLRSGETAIQVLGGIVAIASAAILSVAVIRGMQLRGGAMIVAPPSWMMVAVAGALSLAVLATVAAFAFSFT
jgi:uncharacterized membrane protein YidH (DUF202 family)